MIKLISLIKINNILQRIFHLIKLDLFLIRLQIFILHIQILQVNGNIPKLQKVFEFFILLNIIKQFTLIFQKRDRIVIFEA